MNKQIGFTLTELIVVIVIIGLLAILAVPAHMNTMRRAIIAEAVTGLSSILTVERAYCSEHGSYQNFNPGTGTMIDGIRAGDLTGTYFSEGCYSVTNAGVNSFTAVCQTSAPPNTAQGSATVTRLLGGGQIEINEHGILSSTIPGINLH